MGYNAYLFEESVRQRLLEQFPPKYPHVVADHITQHFGVATGTPIAEPKSVKTVGIADDLVVEVNEQRIRPDQKPYHIAWSCDPSKIAPLTLDPAPLGKQKAKNYRPAHANRLVESGQYTVLLEHPLDIAVSGKYMEDAPMKDKSIS